MGRLMFLKITSILAYVFSMLAAGVIIMVSRMRGGMPEVMVLTGVALGAMFTAGTMFLQYFADDMQLAAMVFWTFGDVARASWTELAPVLQKPEGFRVKASEGEVVVFYFKPSATQNLKFSGFPAG